MLQVLPKSLNRHQNTHYICVLSLTERSNSYWKTCESFKSLFYLWHRSEEILLKGACCREKDNTDRMIAWCVSFGRLSSGTWETLWWNLPHKAQLIGFQGPLNHRGYRLVSQHLWRFRVALHMRSRPELSQGQRSGFGPPVFMGLQVVVETHRAMYTQPH